MHTLTVLNSADSLIQIENFILEIQNNYKLSPKIGFELNLILEELITNKIKYGFSDDLEHLIELNLNIENNLIVIKIIDDADEFDLIDYDKNDINKSIREKEVGGLGIYLLKEKTDELIYERNDNKNILILKKKIS